MKAIKSSVEITFYTPENGASIEQAIEFVARTCYKSKNKADENSTNKFVLNGDDYKKTCN